MKNDADTSSFNYTLTPRHHKTYLKIKAEANF